MADQRLLARGPIDRAAAAAAIDSFLRALGFDPAREPELRGTGNRVAEAFADDLCAGYADDVAALVASNVIDMDGSSSGAASSVVMVRGIELSTTCPHHLMPAVGTADVAFAPSDKLIGVGTVARVVQSLARRLVLQESLGEDVVGALDQGLAPKWIACRIDLAHACMVARGERQHGARVETLSLRGAIGDTEAFAMFGARPLTGSAR